MNDSVLEYLRKARAYALQESEADGSRQLSLVITKIDEAILWRQEDLRLKTPTIDEGNG